MEKSNISTKIAAICAISGIGSTVVMWLSLYFGKQNGGENRFWLQMQWYQIDGTSNIAFSTFERTVYILGPLVNNRATLHNKVKYVQGFCWKFIDVSMISYHLRAEKSTFLLDLYRCYAGILYPCQS